MARQKQRGKSEQSTTRRDQLRLQESLSETYAHTLPVLPAPPAATSRARSTLGDTLRSAAHRKQGHTNERVNDSRHAPRPADMADMRTARMPAPDAYPIDEMSTAASSGRWIAPEDEQALRAQESRLPAAASMPSSRAIAEVRAAEAQPVVIRGTNRAVPAGSLLAPRRQKPRSFLMQFVLSMFTMMAVFSVLAVATPLGHTEAFSATFEGYAGAVRWIPTPTRTPKPAVVVPHYANPGTQTIVNEIVAVFGNYSTGALAVAKCESGYDPNAYNPYPIGGSHASGVFQILYPSTWNTTSYASSSPYNAYANIRAAYQLFSRDGYRWSEWACQP